MPKPIKIEGGWQGEVIHINHFGNVTSNIRIENLGDSMSRKEMIIIRVKGREIKGLVNTFGERPVRELISLVGSKGNLGISVVKGNAAVGLGVKVGDVVEAYIP
jgi:S-adenosyl-L-methionine hydrolase (adenosine-forming)